MNRQATRHSFKHFSRAIAAFCLLMAHGLSAQSGSKNGKNYSLFPFPVVYYTPETNFVFGAAANVTFRLRADSLNINPSTITGGAAYSLNEQLLTYVTYQLFTKNNRHYLFGEAGYYRYTYFFYGTGQNEVPEELYEVNFPRVEVNATRRIMPKLFAGLTYQLEEYAIVEVAENGALAMNSVPGANGSFTSALGPLLVLDTRDQVFYPKSGFYAELSTVFSNRYTGSTHRFRKSVFDLAYYEALGDILVLAFNSYNSFVQGTAPFQQQSLLGGNKRMRGYYEGRYIDKNMAVLQAEARVEVYRRYGAVAFISAGALGNENRFLRINETRFSYGAGLRFAINKEDHLNLRLDYAWGQNTSGFYLTVGEAF